MEKMKSYVVEFTIDDRKHASSVLKGYGVALKRAKILVLEGGQNVIIRGFNAQGHCIFENKVDKTDTY